jgi:hypothetical protein
MKPRRSKEAQLLTSVICGAVLAASDRVSESSHRRCDDGFSTEEVRQRQAQLMALIRLLNE